MAEEVWLSYDWTVAEANEEIRQLQRDLRRTREERDILKKAAAYFIKDPD